MQKEVESASYTQEEKYKLEKKKREDTHLNSESKW